jgi:hypothetical protein
MKAKRSHVRHIKRIEFSKSDQRLRWDVFAKAAVGSFKRLTQALPLVMINEIYQCRFSLLKRKPI